MIDDENDDGDLSDHLEEVKKTPIVEDDGIIPRIELDHQQENKVFISHRENAQASFNQVQLCQLYLYQYYRIF
mgnify:CR=1 FL=1